MIQSLPKEWRIVVLDMPGHGESGYDPDHDYSPHGMAEKIHTVSFFLSVVSTKCILC